MNIPKKEDRAYIKLAKSEIVVTEVAARIFSAFITNNKVTESNEDDFINKSVAAAIKLTELTDARVKSDDEI